MLALEKQSNVPPGLVSLQTSTVEGFCSAQTLDASEICDFGCLQETPRRLVWERFAPEWDRSQLDWSGKGADPKVGGGGDGGAGRRDMSTML